MADEHPIEVMKYAVDVAQLLNDLDPKSEVYVTKVEFGYMGSPYEGLCLAGSQFDDVLSIYTRGGATNERPHRNRRP